MDNKIKFIAWLVVFALVVTIVLFTLFENSAYFETADKTTKLGGSVAFFFVLLMVEFHFINKLHPDSLAPIRANLSGNWIYTADTKEKDKNEISTSTGSAEIHQGDEGKITIVGTIDGRSEIWEADEVVLTDSKLVYFFEIPALELSGVTNLRLAHGQKKSELTELKGYWILAGKEGRGNISFKRVS